MPDVVGIRFKTCGKIYDFEIEGIDVKSGDTVIVESELGLSIGKIVTEKRAVENAPKELKKVLRMAGEGDFDRRRENETLETEARSYCLERIMARGLPMKLICAEATLDKKRIVFYFAAEGRIDFRELVKDLAAKFKTRIEMRQVGVRDEAKMLGGLGMCGRELCCRKFLTSFEPISIRMAKSQELVLNANKLSGVCGRLMCCIGYEYIEGGGDDLGAASVEAGNEVSSVQTEDTSPYYKDVAGPVQKNGKENPTGDVPVDVVIPPVEKAGEPERILEEEGVSAAREEITDTNTPVAAPEGAKSSPGEGKRFRRRRRRHRRRPNK